MNHKKFFFQILNILEENGIEYCLFAGTLLGAVRERDFLESDTKDTDIALDDSNYWKVRKLLDKYVLQEEFVWYSILRKELSVADNDNKFKVDMFFMEQIDEMYAVYSYKPNNRNKRWDYEWRALFPKKLFFPAEQIEFLGRKVSVPKDYENVLVAEYGHWQKPDPTWVSSDKTVLNNDSSYTGFSPAGIDARNYNIDTKEYSIGFICVNFLRRESTKMCIESLQKTAPHVKIYVADQDAPSGEMIEFYETHNVEYYYLPFDCGLSYCRNFLVDKVQEKFLMWGDNDFVFTESSNLNHAITILDARDDIGFVGGAITLNGILMHYERILSFVKEYGILLYLPLELTNPEKHIEQDIEFYYCDLTFNYVISKNFIFKENSKVRWNPKLKVRYEHSILGNQPIVIRKNKQISIVPIEHLMPNCFKDDSGRRTYKLRNTDAWTQYGWKKINYIVSHDYIGKIKKLITRNAYIECTDEHSLIVNNESISAKELQKESKIEQLRFPKLSNKLKVNKDWAWLLGFFLAEGHCSVRKSISGSNYYDISFANQNKNILLKCKSILDSLSIESYIVNTAKRKDNCLFLKLKTPKVMFDYFNRFYIDKEKVIPSMCLDWDKSSRESFFAGFLEGDGGKTQKRVQFSQKSLLAVQSLLYLTQDIFKYYSLYKLSNKYGEWFSVNLYDDVEKKWKKIKSISSDKNIIKNIETLDYSGKVYDLNIDNDNHSFSGGIGNVNLHNSDLFLRIKEYSEHRVVYCPSMIVVHAHEHSNLAYNHFRGRSDASTIFSKDWNLRMNFTVGKGREVYLNEDIKTERELKGLLKIQEADKAPEEEKNAFFLATQVIEFLQNSGVEFWLLDMSCLEVVKDKTLKLLPISIGVRSDDTKSKLEAIQKYISVTIESERKVKSVGIFNTTVLVPLPVVSYLEEKFGRGCLE